MEEEKTLSAAHYQDMEMDPSVLTAHVDKIINEDEDEFESTGLAGKQYTAPESKDKFIDTQKGTLIDKDKLTPFQIIKAVAETTNTIIKDPSTGCHHCYGRGYIGKDVETMMPIPCNCIYPPKTDIQKMDESLYDAKRLNSHMNHEQRRKLKLMMRRELKRIKKQQRNNNPESVSETVMKEEE